MNDFRRQRTLFFFDVEENKQKFIKKNQQKQQNLLKMEISNILKEIKSRGLPASQTIILEFARRRYEMEEESVNELLNKMSENG